MYITAGMFMQDESAEIFDSVHEFYSSRLKATDLELDLAKDGRVYYQPYFGPDVIHMDIPAYSNMTITLKTIDMHVQYELARIGNLSGDYVTYIYDREHTCTFMLGSWQSNIANYVWPDIIKELLIINSQKGELQPYEGQLKEYKDNIIMHLQSMGVWPLYKPEEPEPYKGLGLYSNTDDVVVLVPNYITAVYPHQISVFKYMKYTKHYLEMWRDRCHTGN